MEGGDLQALSQANTDSIERKLAYVLATSTPGKPARPEVEAASLARDLASHASIRRRLPLLVHGGTSLTGPSTLTLSDAGGHQFAVIACTHIPSGCSATAAASKLEVAASLAEARAEALRASLAASQPGSSFHVAVGVATSAHGLQWVVPQQQPGWGQELLLLERAAGAGTPSAKRQVQKQLGAWRLAAALLTMMVAAAVGFAVGSS